MKFDLTRPCSDCPFRKDKKFPLRESRVREIVTGLLYRDASFSCHKTTSAKGKTNRDAEAQHCAGAMIFLEQRGQPTQMMRIAERLGMYDHTKLSKKIRVYKTLKGMVKGCSDAAFRKANSK